MVEYIMTKQDVRTFLKGIYVPNGGWMEVQGNAIVVIVPFGNDDKANNYIAHLSVDFWRDLSLDQLESTVRALLRLVNKDQLDPES
jgi:hypothetical protein